MARLVLIDNAKLKIIGVFTSGDQAEYALQLTPSRKNDTRLCGTMNRDFSVYTYAELRDLYVNNIGPLPAGQITVSLLCKSLGEHVRNLDPDERCVESLKAQYGRPLPTIKPPPPERDAPAPKPWEAKPPRAPAKTYARPPADTVTGQVWIIADAFHAAFGGVVDREAILAACDAEGIARGTSTSQFSRWLNTVVGQK